LGITVSDLLEIPSFKTGCTLAAEQGLCNEVKYVTVMEAPDFHFDSLGDHVLILTTLSAHHSSIEEINCVVEGLCKANVSAIGVKVGRFIDSIDPSTVELAQEYSVPLLSLDANVLFREVLSESLSLISDHQRLIIDQIIEMNRELFSAILQNQSIQELIDLLCAKLPCYCCCLDAAQHKVAEASSLAGGLDDRALRENLDRFFAEQKEGDPPSYLLDGNTIIFPCRAQNQLLGVFCIAMEGSQVELALPLAETVVNALSVKFLEENLKAQAEREMVASILDDILFTRHTQESTITDRLKLLNFTPFQYHLLLILSRRSQQFREHNDPWEMDTARDILAYRFDSVLVFKRGNKYIALISYKGKRSAAALADQIRCCGSILSSTIRCSIDLGCSLPVQQFTSMPDCYQQAKKAIQYGRTLDPGENIFMYDNYFELGLISCGIGSSDGEIFYHRIIGPIQDYDRQYKSQLWATLECCFLHGTLESVAASLFIHISTLRYRLQKIQNLTGYNYFDIKGRMSLYLAYLFHKVSNGGQDV